MNGNRVIFLLDAETVGLYGDPFAISYAVYDFEGQELEAGYLSCPFETAHGDKSDRDWVTKNVIPYLSKETQYKGPNELIDAFYLIWRKIKEKYVEVYAFADCQYPVESLLFIRAVKLDESTRKFLGPYPLHEVSTALWIANIDRRQYPRLEAELPEHHPTKDVQYSARLLFMALQKTKKK